MSLTKLSLGGNNLYMTSLFPHRESLVGDIPARDRNIKKLFYGVGRLQVGLRHGRMVV
jgi:hypothetical protein